MGIYTFIDVSQKQEFIYKHNLLKDNLFNSYIIKAVTEEDRYQAASLMADKRLPVTLSDYLNEQFKDQFTFVYSGGGNSILRFDSVHVASVFIKGYSCEVLRAYPDLELYISMVDESEITDDDSHKEMAIRKLLHERADRLKDKRRIVFRRWTYGVEEISQTGKPEPAMNEEIKNYKLARKSLSGRLEAKLQGSSVEITTELQNYMQASDRGKSYIGIIAIDGNKMGEMVSRIVNFEQLRVFSDTIEEIYLDALSGALMTYAAQATLEDGEKEAPFYVTPIVLAGDDICLIVRGEYAIKVAAQIVDNIQSISTMPEWRAKMAPTLADEPYLSACAGVTIAKVTYPFYEAVKTAEGLCNRAKESMYKVNKNQDVAETASFIDWHIIQGQVMSESQYENFVRHNQYKEHFHIRPLRMDQNKALENGIYSYESFRRLLEGIRSKHISSSVLEKFKKVLYGGWTQYKLFFEMSQIEDFRELEMLVTEVFSQESSVKYAAIVASEGTNSTSYTYVLNDVIEALPFMIGEGELDHVGR